MNYFYAQGAKCYQGCRFCKKLDHSKTDQTGLKTG
jgi:hypothetical protein